MGGAASGKLLKKKGWDMLTCKNIVQAKYPDAAASFHEAVFEVGQASAKWDAYWSIDTSSGRKLATGPMELAAWVKAESLVVEEYKLEMNGAS